ncbi:hypothetical protein OG988_06655 [Streptomyces zaomyceticus]|uniref:hypothetical protein n=1 Tax=Streptomyces zaomyceticus TaxID=68286 RepID=UPI00324BBA2A
MTHAGGYVVQITATETRVTDLAVRGPGGPTTVVGYGYDQAGRLTALTGPDGTDGPVMSFTYDGDGRVTSWTDRNAFTFRYVYDAEGRVAGTVGPEGTLTSTFTYDVHPETGHRVTRYTDSTGATSVLHLNDRLQVVAETDPLGHTTHLTWDAYDRPLTRTDALGHTTELTWSEEGNLIGYDCRTAPRPRPATTSGTCPWRSRGQMGPCGGRPSTAWATAPASRLPTGR